jgi:hypothetical protein
MAPRSAPSSAKTGQCDAKTSVNRALTSAG